MASSRAEGNRPRPALRRWLSLLAVPPIGWVAWLEFSFSPQVNAALTAQRACREIAVWRGERQGISPENAVVGHLERKPYGSGPLPETLKALDYWGRPFLYLHEGECFVLVSYGSDGKPDSNERYDLSLCRETMKRSSCAWPTMDTVFVNGEPLRYCLK